MSDRPTPETDAVVRNAATADHPPTRLAATLTVKCEKLERERDEAREELAKIESLLLDPHAVFLNFLHGKIAKLDWAKLEHIHGPHPARVERDEARAVIRMLWERAETHLDLSDEELDRVNRSWGESAK